MSLRRGRADLPSFVELVRAGGEVITLSEMTPDWLRRQGTDEGLAALAGTGAVIARKILQQHTGHVPGSRLNSITATAITSSRLTRATRRPSRRSRNFSPLFTIDHVFTRNSAVSSIRTIDRPGSDHRALLAIVDLPWGFLDPEQSARQCNVSARCGLGTS